jgi:tetratricopeptide (TPR) repeat protein/tRNA A-37 threonylcarbamoyl transferase component Bud32
MAESRSPGARNDVLPADLSHTRIGRFLIDRKLGTGGMGEVYLARDAGGGRLVGLKRLSARFRNDDRFRQRLRHEALRVSRLSNEHIAAIYESIEESGETFLVMEYVDGTTLRERMREAMTLEESLRVVIECAQGLAAAHTQGIVHHDIKPANIMLCRDGATVKICDFGVARRLPDFFDNDTAPEMEVEAYGGTLRYMAPETILNDRPDGRADIFSLGVVLYETLTRQPPFAADSISALRERILDYEPVSVRRLNPQVPAALERVLARMLAKVPAARYSSAADLLNELTDVQRTLRTAEEEPTEPIVRPSRVEPPAVSIPRKAYIAVALMLPALLFPVTAGPSLPGIPVQKSVVVLRFKTRGGDLTHRAFCDGLTEVLTTRLTRLTTGRTLQVAPLTDVQEHHVTTPAQARRTFGANLALTGVCERDRDDVRITYALTDTGSGRQLRANSASDAATASVAIQDSVIDGAIRMLDISPETTTRAARRIVPAAYADYLLGRGALLEYGKPGNVTAAIEAFKRALAVDPAFAAAHAGLGLAYVRQFELTRNLTWTESSRKECGSAVDLEPGLSEAHVCLGDLHNRTGRYEEAVGEFRLALATEPTSDDGYRGLAYALEQLGKAGDAEKTYREAIRLRPAYWGGYGWLASFLFRQGRYREAAEYDTFALSLSRDNVRLLQTRGAIYVLMGRYEEGIADLERANALQPTPEGFMNLGATYFNVRMFPEAVAALEEATRRASPEFSTIASLADAYYFAPGKRLQAAPTYREALSLGERELHANPRNAWVHVRMASVLAMLGNRDAAVEHVREGTSIAPDDNETAFFGAVTYARLGDTDKTFEWLQRAARAGYSRAEMRMRADFDRLHADPQFTALLASK